MIYGFAMVLLALVIALITPRVRRAGPNVSIEIPEQQTVTEPTPGEPLNLGRRGLVALAGVVGLTTLYVLGFAPLGFYLATFPFIFFSIMVQSRKSFREIAMAAVIATVTTIVVGQVLTRYLGVTLPTSWLF